MERWRAWKSAGGRAHRSAKPRLHESLCRVRVEHLGLPHVHEHRSGIHVARLGRDLVERLPALRRLRDENACSQWALPGRDIQKPE
jgi:hypothetical protein